MTQNLSDLSIMVSNVKRIKTGTMGMLIKSENILQIATQLCDQINPPFQLASLEPDDDQWVLLSDDELKCLEKDNVQIFLRLLLRANSRIVPPKITSEI